MSPPIRAFWSRRANERATLFASWILTLLLISQLVLLAFAYAFMPALVQLIAPGFDADPQKFDMAVGMTRITFPYLAFVTIATLHAGTLNAHGYFAVAAFAPVLLNLFIMGFLAVAFLFPNAGIAASWGVLASGVAQLALLIAEARRRGVLERIAWPKLDPDVRQFFRALGPAVIGSAGQQIAIFADTILASGMPTGAVASINYADRLYQLPLGVIGVAAGTVLLPEMTRRLAAGDRERRRARAKPLDRALARAGGAVPRRLPDDPRGIHPRRLYARRVRRRRGAALGACAGGLCVRPRADGADPLGGRDVPVARRHARRRRFVSSRAWPSMSR